ncbi:MAG TPA: hypothetical protein VJN67_24635 [Stellaceae bacterium]|nr:hypothetical protein [Stellaceae bacterium]
MLATLARSGLAQPIGIWTADRASDRTQLERLCRRHTERRAMSLAPMAAPDATFGLPVFPIGNLQASVAGELDAVLDFRGDGADDGLSPASARLGRWVLRIGGGKSPNIAAALLAAYCSAEPAIDVTLVQIDAGGVERVLFAGRLPKRASLVHTVDAVLLNLPDWYEIACRKLLAGQAAPVADAARPLPPPSLAAFGSAWLAARLRAFRARRTLEIWNIGIAPRPPLEALARGGTVAGVTWLPHPPALTFRADPFGWVDAEGRTAIAHERFDYRVGKGTLEIARVRSATMEPSFEPLADLPAHASYPYLIPVEGMLLCLPEVNESGRTLLFKIETAPTRLTPVATLLGDVPMSDGTIFRFGEHHWLFGTRADRDSQLRLYAWFARSVDGPWTPHALNPIKCDITSARPAGTPFWADGSLIRPAQDCSRSYGGAIALNRIIELTPSTFREETVARLLPDPKGPYPDGIHTLSFVGDSILIDGKRHVFRWNAPALNRNFPLRRLERQAKLRAAAPKR